MKKQYEPALYLVGIAYVLLAIADINSYGHYINKYSYTNMLLYYMPMSYIKIWGIFINNEYMQYVIVLIPLVIWYNRRYIIKLNYKIVIPMVISIIASVFFIFGVGNLFNKLYKRALIQFSIGMIFGIMHFYLVITRWSLDIHVYFNTGLWTISLIMFIYAILVLHDTYLCILSKYNNEPNPKFLGIKIDD